MKKTWLAQGLCIVLFLAMIAGCGGGGDTSPSQSAAQTAAPAQETAAAADLAPADDAGGSKYDMTQEERDAILAANAAELDFDLHLELYPDGLYPVTKERQTMTMGAVRGAINGPMTEMVLFTKLGALANIDIECIDIPAASRVETLNLMLASGEELPDAFWGVNVFSDNDIITYGNSGSFLDFMPYLDVMPTMSAIMEKCQTQFAVCITSDGKLYTLPYIEQQDGNTSVASVHFMNNWWLENLSLEVPTTTDEYVEVLRAFRDQDANGNGDAADEIPLTSSANNTQTHYNYLFGAFGSRDNQDHYEVLNGKVVSTVNTEEYKNAIKWMRSMYEEGLIDPESYTQDNSTYNTRANTDGGLYGALLCWRATAFMSVDNANMYVPVPALIGPDGQQNWSRENNMECIKNAFVMTKDADDPELVARFADTLFNEYISVETNWGPFGIIQNLDANNQWAADDTIVPEGYNFSEWRDFCRTKGPAACLNEYYETFCAWDFNALYRTDILKELYYPVYSDEFYPPLYFSAEDSSRLNAIETQYEAYVNEMQATWVTNGGIDEGWDEYLANLETIGMDEAFAIRQKYYDDYIS